MSLRTSLSLLLPLAVGVACVSPDDAPVGPEGQVTRELRAPLDVTTDTWHDLTVRLSGATLTVDWDGDRVLAFDGLRRMPYGTVGRLGAACRGTGFELADLEVETAAGVERLTGDPLPPATERAFDSLCLSILNLNEFLYVD